MAYNFLKKSYQHLCVGTRLLYFNKPGKRPIWKDIFIRHAQDLTTMSSHSFIRKVGISHDLDELSPAIIF